MVKAAVYLLRKHIPKQLSIDTAAREITIHSITSPRHAKPGSLASQVQTLSLSLSLRQGKGTAVESPVSDEPSFDEPATPQGRIHGNFSSVRQTAASPPIVLSPLFLPGGKPTGRQLVGLEELGYRMHDPYGTTIPPLSMSCLASCLPVSETPSRN
ncbi:hypothetical protein BDP81DRAFT_436971 [Colletotrichum phormii]|uniref:Uncharacterized protein n=1 Tax=Colletotrichum phormii TaxID=359342 RepID=A0AAI9ZI65_9PEZI|nr:uncharacterized protein BDP81DRAFT_436971 [Colletotrichum phormii]KAK1625025.1 hypothetical protein BDP81DRAFT_436971 [Colletotrichum phormii]